MKKIFTTAFAVVALFMLTPQNLEAQHFHRGFVGPGWGANGVSISIGRGIGPGFGSPYGWHRGVSVGYVSPRVYRPVPVTTFYRGGLHPGYHGSFYRGAGFHYGRGFRPGCGW